MNETPAELDAARRQRGLRFVRRLYVPRMIGFVTAAMAVAPVLWTNDSPPVVWLLLGLATFVWPHVAYGLSLSSPNPYRAERRNMLLDSALGGAFIALMKFNLLPSMLLVMSLGMDKLSVGGWQFLGRGLVYMAGACALTGWLLGFPMRLETTAAEMLFSLPHLVSFPVMIAVTTYTLLQRMDYQRRQLEAMSRTDGLSQMLNRQSWEHAVADEFDHARHRGEAASVLILDIDDLQEVNEHHGYPTGDEVIRSVAAILKGTLREGDLPGRYGGEELAVLLPGLDGLAAQELANRARAAVSSSVLEKSAMLRGTVSIGVAELRAEDTDFRQWISHAEDALRDAKRRGGNRTARYAPPLPPRVNLA